MSNNPQTLVDVINTVGTAARMRPCPYCQGIMISEYQKRCDSSACSPPVVEYTVYVIPQHIGIEAHR